MTLRLASALFVILSIIGSSGRSFAQPAEPPKAAAPADHLRPAPVIVAGETLFMIPTRLGSFTPQERARGISERLNRVSKDPLARIDTLTTSESDQATEILLNDLIVMVISEADAQAIGRPRNELAADYVVKIHQALEKSQRVMSLQTWLFNALWAAGETVLLVGLLLLLWKLFPKVYAKLESWQGTVIRSVKFQRVELLSADQIGDLLIGSAKIVRVVVTLVLLYVYTTSVLSHFPLTRGLSGQLFGAVGATLRAIVNAFATYIPNVVSIVVIVFVTRYIIKLIALVFNGIQRGAITFAGFHREWANPTYKIVRFLVLVFAAVAIFPYIPGSQSEAFRGISVFLGILASLGSAGAISNIVAGIVLTYMRPFDIGDRVRIADTVGDIIERTLLVTRVRTIKNVDITIPNAMVLASHIINFSAQAGTQGLILHTSVTIGYDAPWRTVHELLIAAAKATEHILKTPEPFVLQTSLDDFYVTYEINAYTDQPNRMAVVYAELHQNIQDKFNEGGVEIMSPHYATIRDGNKTTIPDQYLPKHYQAPGIRIEGIGTLLGKQSETVSTKGGPRS